MVLFINELMNKRNYERNYEQKKICIINPEAALSVINLCPLA